MNNTISWMKLGLTVLAAVILWIFSFYFKAGNFWMKITFSATCLAALALYYGHRLIRWDWKLKDLLWGAISAATLYAIFYIGNLISGVLFDFAPDQVASIYERGIDTSRVIIVLLLFVTGTAEEIYWRGFLQESIGRKCNKFSALLITTVLYTIVHLPAWNFMLLGAAGVAGLFWGVLYYYYERVFPLVISHVVWSVTIFAIFPVL